MRVLLYIVLAALAGTGIWAFVRMVRAADSLGALAEELRHELPPLVEKAGVTLDSMNQELSKVDGIVTQIEEVSDRVEATTRTAEEMLSAPAAAVAGLGGGVRRFISVLIGRRV